MNKILKIVGVLTLTAVLAGCSRVGQEQMTVLSCKVGEKGETTLTTKEFNKDVIVFNKKCEDFELNVTYTVKAKAYRVWKWEPYEISIINMWEQMT